MPPPGTNVSDEEAARRDAKLDNGEVEELSHDEFVRRVKRERGEWELPIIRPPKRT
jgi:hypothetical protein